MIFITLGSQKFQFDRLLKEVDDLIEKGCIRDEVFAQTGYSNYIPKNYKYDKFLDRDVFCTMEGKANIVITHGGTGAIMGAIKQGKKVIAVPRLTKYKEHVDDHQVQIIKQFSEMNLICGCMDCRNLGKALEEVATAKYSTYKSNTTAILVAIENFIEGIGQ